MTIKMQRELDKIKKKILYLSTKVEEQFKNSLKAFKTNDKELARNVIERDEEIDRMEIELEEECLKVIALYQPVALDLRFLIATIKINSFLERIGDQAVNIAERIEDDTFSGNIAQLIDFSYIEKKVLEMVKMALDSLILMDTDLAHKVWIMDDYVDEANNNIYQQTKEALKKSSSNVEELLGALIVSRSLERVADLATNIAEDVIYMVGGEIVRHPYLTDR